MSLLNKFTLQALILVAASIGIICRTEAQTATTSHYSQYGVGDLRGSSLVRNAGMGGLGQAVVSQNAINIHNPASYHPVLLTTFEAGINSNFVKYQNSANSISNAVYNNSSLGYLAFAFPLSKNKWGLSAGMLPYSSVGYKITSSENVGGRVASYTQKGSGGITNLYLGTGIKVYKGLSAGMNISYLFGAIEKTKAVAFDPSDNVQNYTSTYSVAAGGFNLNYGVLYTHTFKNDYAATLGFTATQGNNLPVSASLLSQTFVLRNGFGYSVDTLANIDNFQGSLKLPFSMGGGMCFGQTNKWTIGADYHTSDWSDYSFFGSTDPLTKSSKMIAGGEYTWKRVRYRAGLRQEKSYLMLNNINIQESALSVGVALPITNGLSFLNITAEIAERGTLSNNLIKEQYVRLVLGLTLSDKWFIPRKFD